MSARIISGKELSLHLLEQQRQKMQKMLSCGIHPKLAVILVGTDPASQVYVRSKQRACEQLGIDSSVISLPQTASQQELNDQIDALNADESVHGILVQLPLPKHLDENAALLRVHVDKDVDGFHVLNGGKLLSGHPATLPCTPRAIVSMLKSVDVPLDGAHAVIVGRSNIVGKPLALLLLGENCTVTVCHTHTKHLKEITKQADILIAAAGKANLITSDMVKPGAAVVDVGINRVEGKLLGDVDFAAVSEVADWITPVPGGVGPMTVRMLMENTLEAACRNWN